MRLTAKEALQREREREIDRWQEKLNENCTIQDTSKEKSKWGKTRLTANELCTVWKGERGMQLSTHSLTHSHTLTHSVCQTTVRHPRCYSNCPLLRPLENTHQHLLLCQRLVSCFLCFLFTSICLFVSCIKRKPAQTKENK